MIPCTGRADFTAFLKVGQPGADDLLREVSGSVLYLGVNPARVRETTMTDAIENMGYEPKRLLFVSSAGGHLSQLLQLKPWWNNHDRHWVTFDLADAHSKLEGEPVTHAHYPTTRNIPNMLRNGRLAMKVLREYKPDVVISNGAGVAFPFFVAARLMGISTVYVEVYDRIESRTLTGRMCKPFATKFLVQWPEQAELYEGSTHIGALY